MSLLSDFIEEFVKGKENGYKESEYEFKCFGRS